MPDFYNNPAVFAEYNSLPESVKIKIRQYSASINSASELRELARRIQSAETGKIF